MTRVWISTDFPGPPNNTPIRIRLTEGSRDGRDRNGTIRLFLAKKGDRSSQVPLQIGDEKIVAQVKAGSWWESARIDFTTIDPSVYDVLVFEGEGSRIERDLDRIGRRTDSRDRDQNRDRGGQAPGRNKEEQFTLRFTNRPPEAIRDDSGKLTGYHIRVHLSAFKGKNVAPEVPIDFLVNNRKAFTASGEPLKTEEGILNFIFKNIPPGGPDGDGFVTLEARISGTSVGKAIQDIPVPEEQAEEPAAKSLLAMVVSKTKVGDAVHHTVRVLVRDQHNKGKGNVHVVWNCGETGGTGASSDADNNRGWLEHDVVVTQPGKFAYQAMAPAEALVSDPLELEGPEQRQVSSLKQIEARFPIDPDAAGNFPGTVITRDKYGKPASRQFCIEGCPEDLLDLKTNSLINDAPLDPPPNGVLRLKLKFKPNQVTLRFCLLEDPQIFHEVTLVK